MFKRFLFLFVRNKFIYSKLLALSVMVLTITSCACTDTGKHQVNKGDSKDSHKEIAALGSIAKKTSVKQAVAMIKSFKGDQVKGKVTFTKQEEGIRIIADIQGLTPGKHGFHIHEFGDCSKEGAAAGDHFNPTHQKHGGPDDLERHVGDLGNLIADQRGNAHYERIDKIITFEGENSILGRSLIIHADPDDYTTQPTGHSGTKIACGIIEAIENK